MPTANSTSNTQAGSASPSHLGPLSTIQTEPGTGHPTSNTQSQAGHPPPDGAVSTSTSSHFGPMSSTSVAASTSAPGSSTMPPVRDLLLEEGITLREYSPGQKPHMLCPKCQGGSSSEHSLAVNITEGSSGAVWKCHRANCGWEGHTNQGSGTPCVADTRLGADTNMATNVDIHAVKSNLSLPAPLLRSVTSSISSQPCSESHVKDFVVKHVCCYMISSQLCRCVVRTQFTAMVDRPWPMLVQPERRCSPCVSGQRSPTAPSCSRWVRSCWRTLPVGASARTPWTRTGSCRRSPGCQDAQTR